MQQLKELNPHNLACYYKICLHLASSGSTHTCIDL